MEFNFAYELLPEQEEEINAFYHSLEYVTIEQYPAWAMLERGNIKNCFFTARVDGRMVCSAIIRERKARIFRFAIIPFGPLFKEPESLTESLLAIQDYYRGRRFVFLTVQLAIPTGNTADLIEYRLNRAVKIHTGFNRDNWSSIVLDLTAPEEDIRRGFSKGHKSDLKKSEKNNISVSAIATETDWEAFCRIYAKMNQKRGNAAGERQNEAFLRRAWDFLKRTGQGDGLVVKDETGKVLGGIMLVYQGATVRYFKGASDPDQRQTPILHAALWEGIKRARTMGYRHFDFWGYNHFVNENDQVFNINRFKKGFGGSYSFYPKKMNMLFRPGMYRLYVLLSGLQQRWKK